MKNKKPLIISIVVMVGLLAFFYLCGLIAQVFGNYADWQEAGGFISHKLVKPIDWNPLTCIAYTFTPNGWLIIMLWISISIT